MTKINWQCSGYVLESQKEEESQTNDDSELLFFFFFRAFGQVATAVNKVNEDSKNSVQGPRGGPRDVTTGEDLGRGRSFNGCSTFVALP